MIRLALTGGIACGKSFCLSVFKSLNYPCINADDVAHSLYNDNKVLDSLKTQFKDAFVRDVLDRKLLANIVFSDKEKLTILNKITHPIIQAKLQEFITNCKKAGEELCVMEIPLLFEANMQHLADYSICCFASPSVQLSRLITRDNITAENAAQRIASQFPLSKKCSLSDFVVDTSLGFESSKEQILSLLKEILSNATGQ